MRYLVVLIILAGCAAKTESFWVKPSATEADFHQDRGQCMAQSSAALQGPMSMQAMMIFGGCMQGKGWYREERATSTQRAGVDDRACHDVAEEVTGSNNTLSDEYKASHRTCMRQRGHSE